MSDQKIVKVRAAGDLTDRIAIKGLGLPDDPRRLLVSGAAEAIRVLGQPDIAKLYGLDYRQIENAAYQMGGASAIIKEAQARCAEIEQIKASLGHHELTAAMTQAKMQMADIRQSVETGFGIEAMKIAASFRESLGSAVQNVVDQQRAMTEMLASVTTSSYMSEMHRLWELSGVGRLQAQIAAITASFRLPEFTVDPIVADMFVIFRGSPKRARDRALGRVALWFIQRRLERHRLRATMRRLDAATIQAAILLVIDSDEFRGMTPREAKEKMPELVHKKLGERPAIVSDRRRPTYKIKRPHGLLNVEAACPARTALDAMVGAEQLAAMRRLLRRVNLTRGERETIELLCTEDLTVDQIARRRKVSPNAVRMQRLRAAKKIGRHLKAERRRPS